MAHDFYRLVRVIKLREELKPVEIYPGWDPDPIRPDWVGIIHSGFMMAHREDIQEGFLLSFRDAEGRELASEQFDTLAMTIDQANAIVGIKPDEWLVLEIDMPDADLPWEAIERQLA